MYDFPVLSKESAQIDLQSTGDKAIITVPFNCKVVACGLVVESAEASAAVVAFDKRVKAGSDTGRVDAALAEIELPAADKQGKILYENKDDAGLELEAGDQVVIECTTASAAEKLCVAFIEFVRLHEVRSNLADAELA